MSGRELLCAYLAAGLVRSLFKTRLVVVYLLCAVLWLPIDALFWLHRRLYPGETIS